MPPTSSLGAAPLKQRTINVEVNLLAEWLERRNRLRDERLRWTGMLATLVLVAVVSIPYLRDVAAVQQRQSQKASSEASGRAAALIELQQQQSLVQPKIDSDAMVQQCRHRAKQFMFEFFAVLNATTPKMAVETVDASVLGGEITIRTKAQAETYLAAQDYVALAGKGSRVKSSILSTARQSNTLGIEGVTFEFAKRLEVGK